MNELTIGQVMSVWPLNFDDFVVKTDPFNEISRDTLLERIILCIVAYFSVATELRFLWKTTQYSLEKRNVKDPSI